MLDTLEKPRQTYLVSYTFTKLFSSITESTIWVAPDPHRLCWITMLAMADRQGRVFGSIPGLANRARIDVEACRGAIASFLAPDPDSRTKDFEGRRIEEIDGGWRLINHAKYRALQDEETLKEAKRKWWHENKGKLEETRKARSDYTQAEAEADTEAKKEKKQPRKRGTPLPEGFAISERVKTWALQKGLRTDLQADLEFFVGRMRANGKTYSDWDEAFMNCVREDWGGFRKGTPLAAAVEIGNCASCGRSLEAGFKHSSKGRLCHGCF